MRLRSTPRWPLTVYGAISTGFGIACVAVAVKVFTIGYEATGVAVGTFGVGFTGFGLWLIRQARAS